MSGQLSYKRGDRVEYYVIFFYVHGTVHLNNTSFIKFQRDATYSVYLVYFLQLYMFRTQSASIFRSNFLQTVVAATGVCYRVRGG